MKILCIAVPQVPHYVNAGHSLPVYEVAGYVRKKLKVQVTALDASKGEINWSDLARLLHSNKFEVIAIMHDLGASFEGLRMFLEYSRSICPTSKIIIFGRQVSKIPNFYQRYKLDGIVVNGDYETGVSDFITSLLENREDVPGVALNKNGAWNQPTKKGRLLAPTDWALPDFKEINYAQYDKLYSIDQNKNCGIPNRRELVVPIARGCPIGCNFCEVWKREGTKERRLEVAKTVEYIENAFREYPFEYVSFYAPTFTLRKDWVKELCNLFIEKGKPYPWKCTTALPFLDESLIELMAKSGCIRISVGLETLGKGRDELPKVKRVAEKQFEEVASLCRKYGVELNCFVILGIPGENVADAEYTAFKIREAKARYRPTAYEENLEDSEYLTEEKILVNMERRFFHNFNAEEVERLNGLLFNEENPTKIMERIPRKRDEK